MVVWRGRVGICRCCDTMLWFGCDSCNFRVAVAPDRRDDNDLTVVGLAVGFGPGSVTCGDFVVVLVDLILVAASKSKFASSASWLAEDANKVATCFCFSSICLFFTCSESGLWGGVHDIVFLGETTSFNSFLRGLWLCWTGWMTLFVGVLGSTPHTTHNPPTTAGCSHGSMAASINLLADISIPLDPKRVIWTASSISGFL